MSLNHNAYSILEYLRLGQATKAIFTRRNPTFILEEPSKEKISPQTKPTTSEWFNAFTKSKPINTVTSLEVDLNFANWDPSILDLATKIFPNLLTLQLFINPNKHSSINLNFQQLTKLDLVISKKNKNIILELNGYLPSLVDFKLTHHGLSKINAKLLAALLLSSVNTLASVTIFSHYGWLLAEEIGKALRLKPSLANPHFVVHQSTNYQGSSSGLDYSNDKEGLYLQDWQAFCGLRSLGFEIELTSVMPLIDCLERFKQVKESLQLSLKLLLQSDQHNFLIKEPNLLSGFDSLENLEIFNASELTRQGFVWLTTNLPSLKKMRLTNNCNPEFSTLDLQSKTLTNLILVHFHHLENYLINCPSLQELELGYCSEKDYPADENMLWCNGNLGERFFNDLLNGSTNVYLPELKKLYIWHSANGFGSPLIFEPLRLDIDCTVGHLKLEEIAFSRLSHIRSLTLKNLPQLNSLTVLDDFDKGEGWLEKLDISAIQAHCEIKINCLSDQPKIGKIFDS